MMQEVLTLYLVSYSKHISHWFIIMTSYFKLYYYNYLIQLLTVYSVINVSWYDACWLFSYD